MMQLTQSEQVWLKDLLELLLAETLTKARERARAAGADQIKLEFLFGGDADMAQHRAGELGEEAFDEIEPRAGGKDDLPPWRSRC